MRCSHHGVKETQVVKKYEQFSSPLYTISKTP